MKAFLLRLATAVLFVPALLTDIAIWVLAGDCPDLADRVIRWSEE